MSSNTRKRIGGGGTENVMSKRRRREGTEDSVDTRLTENSTDPETGKEEDVAKNTGDVTQEGELSESNEDTEMTVMTKTRRTRSLMSKMNSSV